MENMCIFLFLTLTLAYGQYAGSFVPPIAAGSEIQTAADGFESQEIAEGVYAKMPGICPQFYAEGVRQLEPRVASTLGLI